jgi:DNA-binding HxlR family transcriptional regulator
MEDSLEVLDESILEAILSDGKQEPQSSVLTRRRVTMTTPAPTIGTRFTPAEIARARRYAVQRPAGTLDPRLAALVHDLIDRVADKWTMLVLEVLTEQAPLRFSRLAQQVSGISQKMLTQTVRQMERDGLVTRTVFAEVPPRVEYELTPLGLTLGGAFCGVWVWASDNLKAVEKARQSFDAKPAPPPAGVTRHRAR